jgi:hypothetical protein
LSRLVERLRRVEAALVSLPPPTNAVSCCVLLTYSVLSPITQRHICRRAGHFMNRRLAQRELVMTGGPPDRQQNQQRHDDEERQHRRVERQ